MAPRLLFKLNILEIKLEPTDHRCPYLDIFGLTNSPFLFLESFEDFVERTGPRQVVPIQNSSDAGRASDARQRMRSTKLGHRDDVKHDVNTDVDNDDKNDNDVKNDFYNDFYNDV